MVGSSNKNCMNKFSKVRALKQVTLMVQNLDDKIQQAESAAAGDLDGTKL